MIQNRDSIWFQELIPIIDSKNWILYFDSKNWFYIRFSYFGSIFLFYIWFTIIEL